jgi:hypothetical protein
MKVTLKEMVVILDEERRAKKRNKKITGNEESIYPWNYKMDAETDDEYDL